MFVRENARKIGTYLSAEFLYGVSSDLQSIMMRIIA